MFFKIKSQRNFCKQINVKYYISGLLCFLLILIFNNLFAQNDTTSARKYFNQAKESFKKADYQSSKEQLEKASSIYQKAGNWKMYISCLERAEAILAQEGKYDSAEEISDLALREYKNHIGKEQPLQADLLNTLGFVQLNKGRNDTALENFQEALRIYRKFYPDKNDNIALCFTNIGLAYNSTGNQELALEYQQKALIIRQQLYGEKQEQVGDSYNNIGLEYTQQDKEKALEYYQKALAIYIAVYGENHPKVARVYNNIALVYVEQKEYEEALKNYRKSLSVLQNVYNDEHPNLAFVYSNMGRVFEEQKDFTKALTYQNQALDIYHKNYGNKHYEVANTYNSIGNIHRKLQKYKIALDNFQEALIANSINFEAKSHEINPSALKYFNPNVLLNSLLYKAETLEELYFQKSLYKKDLELSLQTLKVCDTLIDNIRQIRTNKSDKLALGSVASQAYEDAIRISTELSEISIKKQPYVEQAFHFSEKSKSSVLLEAIADAQAKNFANIPDELIAKEKALKSDITFYEQKLAEKQDAKSENEYRNKLFSLNENYRSFTKKLEKDFPQYYNLKYSAGSVSMPELQNRLDDKTALISYFIGDFNQRIYVFYLTKESIRIYDVPKTEKFDKFLNGIRNAIKNDIQKVFVETAYELHKTLFPKIISKKIQKVVIIPDGKLGMLPFEALLTKKAKKEDNYQQLSYLIRRYAMSYDYSAELFYQTIKNNRTDEKHSILFVAPVDFPENMNDLPATESEVEENVKLFKENGYTTGLFVKKKATESIIKSNELKKYSILHFATHGFVNQDKPELSQIYFVEDLPKKEDGNLYAGEIYNLDIKADLVTLSACQTGLGKVAKGEGMIGLCRALLYAGAKNLLVSLWSVSDKSTEILMSDFYKDWLAKSKVGNDYSQSLQQAKLKLISDVNFNRPYFWAPFIFIGK